MNDIINAAFEFGGAIFLCHNCITLYKDKAVSGVSILSTAFFTGWGFWNIYYYPTLDQVWSMIAAIALTFFNVLWVGQMIYYRRANIKNLSTSTTSKTLTYKQQVRQAIDTLSEEGKETIEELISIAENDPKYSHLSKADIINMYAVQTVRLDNGIIFEEDNATVDTIIQETFGCSIMKAKSLRSSYNILCGEHITDECHKSMGNLGK